MKVRDGDVRVYTDGNVTIAIMTVGGITVAGSAKREPGDKNDEDIGIDLAIGRAMYRMSKRLLRRANGAVKQASYVKADRPRVEASRRQRQEQPTGRADVSPRTRPVRPGKHEAR